MAMADLQIASRRPRSPKRRRKKIYGGSERNGLDEEEVWLWSIVYGLAMIGHAGFRARSDMFQAHSSNGDTNDVRELVVSAS